MKILSITKTPENGQKICAKRAPNVDIFNLLLGDCKFLRYDSVSLKYTKLRML
jgi:hypothetical protein